MRSFFPILGSTKSISATTSSASVALDKGLQPNGEYQVRVYNAGTDTVFVRWGASSAGSVTATSADIPVPSGAIEVLTVTNPDRDKVDTMAAIAASSTATVYFTVGHGI